MRSNEVNKPSGSRWLQSEVRTIAGEIADTPISPKKYQHLSRKLDNALEKLQGLESKNKTTSLFAKAQTEHLKEQVVKLYGDLEDGLVKREVSQIKEESTSLKKGRLTLKAVKKLEMHINELESNHLTSIPDRRIIADAKHALLEARAKLEGKPVAKHIDWLAKQRPVQFTEEIQLLPGEVEELFDIARAVYNRDFRQAKMRYNALPEDHKRMFQKHMQNLMAKPFDDPLETCQAMIATANELVENGEGYPSQSQIDQLFLGLSQLNTEERAEGKIFSLKSREPLGG
ncbi:MAG: hypothetical protein JSS60_05025 [Verrucomicrobia bacterium]|nr:hypothetical protein [Verrucomicrobiota bacterium]